ncbi:hypothetical protein Micbo1qcDRAFT_17468 [Microdochium bolleyi]|uniref:Uncharacterized protein n=1 Tax=Microdochium bolleyi TaxID=196109 RepID=A0A136IUH0_9PEZI|nr:hypothetical protein Micbo1qcDRAFT_17468 [Microdochium bolleyi]
MRSGPGPDSGEEIRTHLCTSCTRVAVSNVLHHATRSTATCRQRLDGLLMSVCVPRCRHSGGNSSVMMYTKHGPARVWHTRPPCQPSDYVETCICNEAIDVRMCCLTMGGLGARERLGIADGDARPSRPQSQFRPDLGRCCRPSTQDSGNHIPSLSSFASG